VAIRRAEVAAEALPPEVHQAGSMGYIPVEAGAKGAAIAAEAAGAKGAAHHPQAEPVHQKVDTQYPGLMPVYT